MKFRVTFKDPDGVYDSLRSAAEDSVANIDTLNKSEKEQLVKIRQQGLSNLVERWIEYGEYITIEFDTEMNSARIVELE